MRNHYRNTAVLLTSLIIIGCATIPGQQPSPPSGTQSSFESLYHYSLGVLFSLNDEPDAAIAEYEAALQLDPYSEILTKELAEL